MAQTDRQTDRERSIHWNSGIFDCSGNWEKLKVLPEFVKEVHSQQEICPTTGRIHRQTHVWCHRQVTLNQMRKWIQTHWNPVKGAEYIANSLNYCRKKETAVEGTFEVQKGEKYLRIHELLLAVAKAFRKTMLPVPPPPSSISYTACYSAHSAIEEYEKQFLFKNAARKIIQSEGLVWIDKLSNPVVEKMWNYFHKEILAECEKLEKAEGDGGFIIEPPAQ